MFLHFSAFQRKVRYLPLINSCRLSQLENKCFPQERAGVSTCIDYASHTCMLILNNACCSYLSIHQVSTAKHAYQQLITGESGTAVLYNDELL